VTRKTEPLSMPPEKATPIGSVPDECASMLRSHFAISSASAPMYRRPISPASAGSELRSGVKNQLDDVVCRHHARVARVELVGQAVPFQRLVQRVNPVGHVQRRPFVAFGQKVAHGAVHRPRHPDVDALGGHDGERAVDRADPGWVAVQHMPARFLEVHVGDAVERGVEQVDHAIDGLQHDRIVRQRRMSSRAHHR
jgi:hypothetical protein